MAKKRIVLPNGMDFGKMNFVPPALIVDLKTISGIEQEKLNSLSSAIHKLEGFVSPENLKNLITEFLENKEDITAVIAVFRFIEVDDLIAFSNLLQRWRESSEENQNDISDSVFENIKANLTILIQDYGAINLFRKAQRLHNFTGNNLERADIICDVRPVFDKNRTTVEGILPLTTLRLSYEEQSGDEQVIELVLSEPMLNDLKEKIEMAEKKIKVLSEAANRWASAGVVDLK